jgi:hypothetical protein
MRTDDGDGPHPARLCTTTLIISEESLAARAAPDAATSVTAMDDRRVSLIT